MNTEEAIKNGTVKAGEVRPDFEVLPVNVVRLLLSLREQEIWDKIEGMKKRDNTQNSLALQHIWGYNQALSDIIKEIK